MSEQTPSVSNMQLMFAHAVFVGETSATLQLNQQEQHYAMAGDPMVWGHWAVSTFSGGERLSLPEQGWDDMWLSDPEARPFFAGETYVDAIPALDFRTGALAQKVDRLHQSKDRGERERFIKFSERMGEFVLTYALTLGRHMDEVMPPVAQTSIARINDTVKIYFPGGQNDVHFSVNGPVDKVVTFGPGMSGSTFGGGLAGIAQEVHYVSGGKGAPFVNSVINMGMECVAQSVEMARQNGRLAQLFPKAANLNDIRVPESVFYMDGIAASAQQLDKEPAIDVAVMSAVHSAGVEECVAGVEIAARNLRPDGIFVLKAPDVSIGAEAGMDKVMPRAMQAFGSPAVAGACGELEEAYNGSQSKRRPASFAIFQKS